MGGNQSVILRGEYCKNKISTIELQTLNQIILSNYLHNLNDNSYYALLKWNEMLNQIPLAANYEYDCNSNYIVKISSTFYKSETTLKHHILLNGLTNWCYVILNSYQYKVVTYFKSDLSLTK